jgi:hypothetical protein
MAVLVEGISVILRTNAILAAYTGDWDKFVSDVPNSTLCADGELLRVGFMVPDAVGDFVADMEQRGLHYLRNGVARDLVVVDQQRGPLVPCDWIEFGHVSLGGDPGKRVAACKQKGSTLAQVICPEGWTFESSLSASFGFVPEGKASQSLEFLRRENGLNVYRNRLTGREVFVADKGEGAG